MNTDKTLNKLFLGEKNSSWRTHKVKEVDISYVMWHLLKSNFAVEIDGHKYDVTFGLNNQGEIGQCISMEGSPSLTSYNVINRGFKEGKWFKILDEELSIDEKEEIQRAIKDREEKESIEFFMERLGVSSIEDFDVNKLISELKTEK